MRRGKNGPEAVGGPAGKQVPGAVAGHLRWNCELRRFVRVLFFRRRAVSGLVSVGQPPEYTEAFPDKPKADHDHQEAKDIEKKGLVHDQENQKDAKERHRNSPAGMRQERAVDHWVNQ